MKALLSSLGLISCLFVLVALAASEAAPSPGKPGNGTAKVDINGAPVEALRKLDGISEARAKAIVYGRCYDYTTDLVDRKILPKSAFEKIKEQLTVSQGANGSACARGMPAAPADGKGSEK
jgi:DNA uptake protein ComE-like DNA-binding protein